MTDIDSGEELRQLAKALFAKDASEGEAPPDPAMGNVVPAEGTNPTGEAHDMRAFVKALFAPDPTD